MRTERSLSSCCRSSIISRRRSSAFSSSQMSGEPMPSSLSSARRRFGEEPLNSCRHGDAVSGEGAQPWCCSPLTALHPDQGWAVPPLWPSPAHPRAPQQRKGLWGHGQHAGSVPPSAPPPPCPRTDPKQREPSLPQPPGPSPRSARGSTWMNRLSWVFCCSSRVFSCSREKMYSAVCWRMAACGRAGGW